MSPAKTAKKTSNGRPSSGPLWGLVDRAGTFVVKPTWRGVGGFAEGLCPVYDGERWGYADARGELVVPCRYDEASEVLHGHGVVVRGGERGWAVDRHGREARRLRFTRPDGIVEIVDGPVVEAVTGTLQGARSWLLPDGVPAPGAPLGADRFVVPATATSPERLFDGHGRLVKQLDGFGVTPFVEGMARMRVGKATTFIHIDGSRLDGAWEHADDFAGGLARVRLPEGGDGFIDAMGRVVIAGGGKSRKGARMFATSFAEGLAIVDLSGRKGLMDRSGNMAVAPRLARLSGPHAGRWYGEDLEGRAVMFRSDGGPVPIAGREPSAIAGGPWLALVRDGKRGVIDADGHELAPFEYDEVGSRGPVLRVSRIGADGAARWGYFDLAARREGVACRFLDNVSFAPEGVGAVLAAIGDESHDHPFRFYGVSPDDWRGDAFEWRVAFVDKPEPAARREIKAILGERGGVAVEAWRDRFALVAVDAGGQARATLARAVVGFEALHAAHPLAEVVLLQATAGSSGSAWEAWSVRQRARPMKGPSFGRQALLWEPG